MRKRISLIIASVLLCVSNIMAEVVSLPVTIGESEWETFYPGFNVQIPESVEAYVVASVSDGYVNLSRIEGNVIPAATPVMLKAVAGNYDFCYIEAEVTEVGNNLLVGTLYDKHVTMSSDYNYYVFDDDKCAWYPATEIDGMEDCFQAKAYKAYLEVPVAMAESNPYLLIEGLTAIISSGTCGDNLTWKLTSEGELIIEGTGAMIDYQPHSAPWFAYKDDILSVTIKPGVTSIGEYAIGDCGNLTTVTIPGSVTSIGLQAFQYCYKLTSVTLSEGLKSINWGAFAECYKLSSIVIPESVTTIGNYAFTHCYALTSINIPESLTGIGMYAFRFCGLASIVCKAVTPPSMLAGYVGDPFQNVNKDIPVYVPYSAVEAYKATDYWKEFAKILPMGTCGDNLTWKLTSEGELIIEGTGAITGKPWREYRQSINTITVCEGVTDICNEAFKNTNCTAVSLPSSLINIGYEAFCGCGRLTSIVLPQNVKTVGGRVFCDCGSLSSVTLNEGLESIGGEIFRACGALTSIEIPASLTQIANSAFYECKNIVSVVINEGVQTIGSGSFAFCYNIASLTLPASLTTIGNDAFRQCFDLSYVLSKATTPPTINGSDAFYETDKSVPLYVPAASVDAYKAANGWNLFTNIQPSGTCGEDLTWKLTAEGELIIEGIGEMTSAPWSGYKESIKKITIKEGVTSICDNAFMDCNKVVTVTIPKGITTAGVNAFYGCTGEVYLNSIPESSDGMMMGGFLSGGNFTKVIVGDDVIEIKDFAFMYLPNLVELVLPENLTRIGEMAFAGCQNLTTITIPANVASVGRYAFDYCTRLTSVVCKGVTPPVCDGELFWNPEQELVLYVPFATNSTYQSADYWKNFDYVVGTADCGEELTCELWSDGRLAIKGDGVIADTPWKGYEEQVRTLVVAEGVTGFADEAFADFSSLETITSYAVIPPVCGTNVFAGVNKTTPVYVPVEGVEAYSMAEGWSEFVYLGSTESRFLLDSFAEYVQAEDEELEEITYVRNFNNTEWQALYVPFEIPVTEEFLTEFEVADLNDIRQYDRDDDGVADETVVEAFKVTDGVLEANYPYLIRAKETGEKNIIVRNATLYASEENSIDCSSIHEKYIFSGTYNTMDAAALVGCYALSSGVWQPVAEEALLGAFRFYLSIESRDGNMQAAQNIRMRVIGKDTGDGTTGIENISEAENQNSKMIYDLQGRPVTKSGKGMYIINGKKVFIK